VSNLMRVDAWLFLGAVIQLILILRARNFYLKDWLLPLGALLVGSIGWLLFIRLCSGIQGWGPAGEAFPIGFGMALTGAVIYLAVYAPLQLNSTTLLSLTLSFWAVYAGGGVERKWLWAAVPMTVASIAFISGRGRQNWTFRAALQVWALGAASLVAYDAIPASIGNVLGSYKGEELAAGYPPLEGLIAGAQVFLLAQMAIGLLMLLLPETWAGFLPKSGRDENIPRMGIIALIVQAGLFVWLRGANGQAQSQVMGMAVLAALAHGAMTGDDAKPARPVVDFVWDSRPKSRLP
jgi:hypothetical protein